jgi:hypothetical protein
MRLGVSDVGYSAESSSSRFLACNSKLLSLGAVDFDLQFNVNIMDLEEKIVLVTRNCDEIITREELRSMLETTSRPRAYWGFECSGQ